MANAAVYRMPDRTSVRGQVAARVRAELASAKITTNQLPKLVGKSQSYWSRRVNGELAFDVDDLGALQDLLGVQFLALAGTLPPSGPLAQSAELRTFNP